MPLKKLFVRQLQQEQSASAKDFVVFNKSNLPQQKILLIFWSEQFQLIAPNLPS